MLSSNFKNGKGGVSDGEPQMTIKVDREEYYENENVNGSVRIRVSKDVKDFIIRINLTYEEHYVVFNETGDTALLSKDFKKLLAKQDIECKEVYQPGDHYFQFGIHLPTTVKNGTFYHAGQTLSARMTYKLQAKMIEKAKGKDQQDKKCKCEAY